MRTGKRKRLWALLLSAALIVTPLPAVAMAENNPPEDKVNFAVGEREDALGHGAIASFEPLDSGVANQTVEVGTELSGLNLPDEMAATVYHVTEDTVIPDEDNIEDENGDPSTATPSDAEGSVSDNSSGDSSVKDSGKTVTTVTTSEEEIPVTWGSEPAYDGDTEGSYVFTADVGGYVLSGGAELPKITVTVAADTVEKPTGESLPCTQTEGCTLANGHEGDCVPAPPANDGLVKTITSWTFVDDENLNEGVLPLINASMEQQADFDTVVDLLPKQISGSIEGETDPATLDITGWSCPEYIPDGDGNWPLTGEYTFTAALTEGYACDPLPAVKVLLGGAELYASTGDFTVTGGELNTDYTYSNNTLIINTSKPLTISGITSTDKIRVPDGVTANVTLSSVTINVSRTYEACAFTVEAGGRANITLQGTNAMASGTNRAGLEVPENATVTIDGNGSLTAEGGNVGAGIGGGIGGNGGNITISGGTVEAKGNGGAGIGGGNGYSGEGGGGNITISGGTVNANGAAGGAGIGGGAYGSGGTVKISGAVTKVTATSTSGCDVGSGGKDKNDNSGSLSVTDGATLEMKSTGTNVDTPEYKNCTVIDKDGNAAVYDKNGTLLGDRAWDGQSDVSASSLGVGTGNTITITGSNTGGGATLTIDVEGVTVTSNGTAVSGVCIVAADGIGSLTVKDLNLTAQEDKHAIRFLTAATLTVEGTCAITGGATDGDGYHAVSGSSDLTVEVGNAALTATGGESRATFSAGAGIRIGGSLIVKVGNGGNFTVRGGNGAAFPGLGLYGSDSVTVQNDGAVLAESGQVGGVLAGNGIVGGRVTLTGSGKTTAKGGSGIIVGTVLTVEGTVDVEGTISGVLFIAGGSQLAGSGSLVTSGDYDGVMTMEHLELAFTGHLTVHSGGKGSGIWCDGNLTVSRPPASLDIRPGANGDYAIYVNGTFTNETNIPIRVNNVKPVLWPAYVVTYEAPDKTGGTVPEWDVYKSGDTVTVSGNTGGLTRSGYTFSGWKSSANGTTYTGGQTFPMPAEGVTLTAQWINQVLPQAATPVATPAGGIYNTAQTVTLTCATANATIYYTLDGSDPVTSGTRHTYSSPFTVPLGTTLKAYAAASGYTDSVVLTEVYSKKTSSGGSSGGGGGSYSAYKPQSSYTNAGERISQTIPRSDLRLLANDRKSLTLSCDKASMTFEPTALNAILEATKGAADDKVTFAAAPADLGAFPDAAKFIGAHPVYDFTISYKDSKGNPVVVPVNFPAGSASISLNYTPAAVAVTGSLFMVYVDGKGAVTWLDKSSYDNGKVLAEIPHFSTYGVAYKAPAPVFTDIGGHWAKADIEFVAARGLLSGTGNNLFSPDGAMTRGMFVTALGRLAGANPDSYKTRSFTDVKADAYYAAYVEWAAQKNIVKGTGEGLFSPDTPVTREQMAVMMVNYAGQMGYSIPTPLAAVTFADNDRISTWAAKEVAAMQRAGIIKGKDGNRFDPQASATRAEVSAVLRRFVEIIIDPATATGWVKNDSGHWLYYKDGKALTGWKQIGSKWYYFDKNGIMAVNTKVDGYEIGPDGARKEDN